MSSFKTTTLFFPSTNSTAGEHVVFQNPQWKKHPTDTTATPLAVRPRSPNDFVTIQVLKHQQSRFRVHPFRTLEKNRPEDPKLQKPRIFKGMIPQNYHMYICFLFWFLPQNGSYLMTPWNRPFCLGEVFCWHILGEKSTPKMTGKVVERLKQFFGGRLGHGLEADEGIWEIFYQWNTDRML